MSTNLKLFELNDRVAVVTGGLGMLGQRFTVALVEYGARVVAMDRVDRAPKMLPEFERYREEGKILLQKADITKRSEIEKVFQEVQSKWEAPHILVNNAALDSPPNAPAKENGPFETFPESSLDQVIDVNLKGTIFCSQVFGGEMAKRKRGSIINICSIYGLVSPIQDIYEYKRRDGNEWFKPVAYAVSKAAVANFTRYLATYWGKTGVRVNTITPAGISNGQDQEFIDGYTKRVPIGRMAEQTEVNGALVFLASDASSYMTGSNLIVDGGWTAW